MQLDGLTVVASDVVGKRIASLIGAALVSPEAAGEVDLGGPVLLAVGLAERAAAALIDRAAPGWVVLSSTRLDSLTPDSSLALSWANEGVALARGATVLRTSMLFGRGLSDPLSCLLESSIGRSSISRVSDPLALLQPLHIDDISSLVQAAIGRPDLGGRYVATGPEVTTIGALLTRVARLRGDDGPGFRRTRLAAMASAWTACETETIADDHSTRALFAWSPQSLELRLRQTLPATGVEAHTTPATVRVAL